MSMQEQTIFEPPIFFEATHVDTGYHAVVKIDKNGFCFGRKCEAFTADSYEDAMLFLELMESNYGEAWIFEPVPLESIT